MMNITIKMKYMIIKWILKKNININDKDNTDNILYKEYLSLKMINQFIQKLRELKMLLQ